MATSPEKRIQAALVSEIGALTYIATNSIQVQNDDDMTKEKASALVNVDVLKANRLEPNYDFYQARVELTCETHIPNDEADTVGENLYAEVNEYVQTLTASVLNSAVSDSEVTVDGIVPNQNEEYLDDNFRQQQVVFDCFYTYTPTT